MYDKLMKHTAVIGTIFTIVAMSIMIYVAMNTPVVIEETEEDSSVQYQQQQLQQNEMTKELIIEQDENQPVYLCIPLEGTTTDDKLKLEADYVEQQLCITIQDQEENFYSQNKVTGNTSAVNKILWNYKKNDTKLLIQLNGVYEHNAFCKNNVLYLEFTKPRESYDKIVVVDAGNQHEQITTNITKKLREKLSQNQTDLKVYYTGMDNTDTTLEKKIAFANQLKADMFVSVQVLDEESYPEKKGVQAICNPAFFIPELNSVSLSDLLEQNVCQKTGASANGILEGSEEDVLVTEATVPAAIIQVGNVSNKQDKTLLEDDAYVGKIADGIFRAIEDAYTYKERGSSYK